MDVPAEHSRRRRNSHVMAVGSCPHPAYLHRVLEIPPKEMVRQRIGREVFAAFSCCRSSASFKRHCTYISEPTFAPYEAHCWSSAASSEDTEAGKVLYVGWAIAEIGDDARTIATRTLSTLPPDVSASFSLTLKRMR